jgi:hypothetical protein
MLSWPECIVSSQVHPEAVSVQLESFSEPITMYRFDAVQQQHLLDAIFMVISKLNVNLIIDGIKPSHHLLLICAKSQMDHGMVRLYRILGRSSGLLPSILTNLLERRVAEAYSLCDFG